MPRPRPSAAQVADNLGPAQDTSFSPIVLSEATLPGFKQMVVDRRLTFQLHPCMEQFVSKSHTRVKKVGG